MSGWASDLRSIPEASKQVSPQTTRRRSYAVQRERRARSPKGRLVFRRSTPHRFVASGVELATSGQEPPLWTRSGTFRNEAVGLMGCCRFQRVDRTVTPSFRSVTNARRKRQRESRY